MKIRTMQCLVCGNTSILDIDEESYNKWLGGMLIQKAFPDMSKDTREMLITGTHPGCFDTLRGEEE